MIYERRKKIRDVTYKLNSQDWSYVPVPEARPSTFLIIAFIFEVIVIGAVLIGFLN